MDISFDKFNDAIPPAFIIQENGNDLNFYSLIDCFLCAIRANGCTGAAD